MPTVPGYWKTLAVEIELWHARDASDGGYALEGRWMRWSVGLGLTVEGGRRLLSACPTDFIFHDDHS